MKITKIACAFGYHRIDESSIRHVHAGHVGRCRRCSTAMEELEPHVWVQHRVHDAGLGPRGIR